jgi:hypothetical protein
MLRSVDWLLITDVSGQTLVTVFKDQADSTLEDGADRLLRNVGKQLLLLAA